MRAVSEFPFSLTLDEPCRNYTFRVKWDGRYIPAITRVLGLTRTTEVVENRDGSDPSINRKSAGLTRFEAITLERGLTGDTSFEEWANLVWNPEIELGSEASVREFRKNILIELYEDSGQLVRTYIVRRAWPSEYQALSTLDAGENGVVIERMRLESEGWEREAAMVPQPQS
jgi:phage tail-like protein